MKRKTAERERRAAEQETARLAALSSEGRQVGALRERLQRHYGRKQPVGGALFAEIQKLLRIASEESWSSHDRRALAEVVESLGFEKIDFGGRVKDVRRAIATLRGAS